jgi:hypothetical protein
MIFISVVALKCALLCRPLEPRADDFLGCICRHDGGFVIPEMKNKIKELSKETRPWHERTARKP